MSKFWKLWIDLKKEAIKTKDYEFYHWFLIETQKTFSKLYADVSSDEGVALVESVIKQVSKEIVWVKNKKREKSIDF